MNIEEPCLDLCNVKTKNNVDNDHNTTNNIEGVTPRISELITDSNTEKQTIVPTETSEMYLMPQLTDNIQAPKKDNQETLEIDEVNGNGKGSAQGTSAAVNPTDFTVSNSEKHKDDFGDEKIKGHKDGAPENLVQDGDDGGDMDIGVDLSLDESGVLESESGYVSSDNTSELVPTPQDDPFDSTAESQSDPNQTCSTDVSVSDQAGLYPSVQEGDSKHKSSGKRVTFPSDDDIISGAVEPKDPWRHAQNVTVEEILSSYRQACQKLNCKLIPKVLKQIQEMKDLTQRNECLDLKGEKLDYKACESLEEILKRVQFKTIDLEQTNLDEDGASALFDMIEYYESATHLNISFNKHIGTRGWQAAAHMMRKTSSLQYLDARNTPLLDHSVPFVARALRISGSLAVLHLENAGLSGRPLMLLATALKMNMNLRELYLADNKLNGLQDSAQLGNLLKFNYNIQILDLRNNHILDSGLAYICEGLKEQRKGLITLVLWNNQLTHNGMGYLAAALPCTQSLETLNLGHNSVGNEGVHKLKDGLIGNRSVLRLGLASTKLSCEGAVAVAEFIAESPRLLRLDLRENEIKTGGLMALSLALKVNTSLLRLDLDREPKKETVKSFIETQRALLAEIQNGCKRNFILAKEKEENEQKMRQSASMAEIATEDGTRADEEQEAASEEKPDETTEKESQTSSQTGARESEVNVPQTNLESDSDTEDEEEADVATKPSSTNSSSVSNQTTPQSHTVVSQSPVSASHTASPPSASPAVGPTVISSITVTETAAPPGTPPSPGRCISVSSPGRGHKIFMVTRVESPPEPKPQTTPPAASKKPVNMNKPTAQQTVPSTSPQTQLTQEEVKECSDCKNTEPSPVALNTAQTHKPEPRSTTLHTENVKAKSLEPDAADARLQTPAERPQPEPAHVEVKQEDGQKQSDKLNQPMTSLPVPQQLTVSALEQKNNLVSASEETQTSNQPDETAGGLSANLTEKEEQSQEELIPKQQTEAGETETEPVLSVQAPSVTQGGADPPEGEASTSPASTSSEEAAEENPNSPLEEDREESADESSADDGECFADALEEEVIGSLPNGLKPEFSLHLLDTETPKPGSCVMEHVSVSCGQDLEELLLEASLETGRDAP
ncbi:protein phosphatase 1 regulatory subunit 37 [Pholidichthys leucotaenia]